MTCNGCIYSKTDERGYMCCCPNNIPFGYLAFLVYPEKEESCRWRDEGEGLTSEEKGSKAATGKEYEELFHPRSEIAKQQ